jgi:hypothetical protein
MDCLECRHLDRTFRRRLTLYLKACSSPYCQVSSSIAASNQVDMERAKNDMEEHLFACPLAAQMGYTVKREVSSA